MLLKSTKCRFTLFTAYANYVNYILIYQYLRGEEWFKRAFQRLMGLKATVLYRDSSTEKFYLNFDPRIHGVIREAEIMLKIGSKVSEKVVQVLHCKKSICCHKSR